MNHEMLFRAEIGERCRRSRTRRKIRNLTVELRYRGADGATYTATLRDVEAVTVYEER